MQCWERGYGYPANVPICLQKTPRMFSWDMTLCVVYFLCILGFCCHRYSLISKVEEVTIKLTMCHSCFSNASRKQFHSFVAWFFCIASLVHHFHYLANVHWSPLAEKKISCHLKTLHPFASFSRWLSEMRYWIVLCEIILQTSCCSNSLPIDSRLLNSFLA